MNWFQQNRWLGTFLIIFGIATIAALGFLWHAKGQSNQALARFTDAATERKRLENLDPFPNEANFRKVRSYLDTYAASLEKLKTELKTRSLPEPVLAPNEFQSRLRQAMLAVSEKARNNRVALPENFALGFEEYTAALPNTAAAPLLGQQLSQIELLVNILIDARVDGLASLKRTPLPEEGGAVPTPTPATPGRKPAGSATPSPGQKMVERGVVDITFASSPSAARKVLNQIGSSTQQFFIVRTLYVHNEKDKGPPREKAASTQTGAATGTSPTPAPANAKAPPSGNLSFIVGNEHIDTSARIELVRFVF